MTTPHLPQILALSDAGKTPAQIAAALPVKIGTVYAALREHRPARKCAPRTRTSAKRVQILGLLGQGITASRVAFLTDVSDKYVYRILAETKPG